MEESVVVTMFTYMVKLRVPAARHSARNAKSRSMVREMMNFLLLVKIIQSKERKGSCYYIETNIGWEIRFYICWETTSK